MKILVDADGCPVKNIIVRIAKEYKIPVTMFADTSHLIDDGYSEVVIVGKGYDSVDFALINNVDKGDIIVTQDYGVATMTLSKKAYSINQNGLIYTNDNMDRLLFQRYLSKKVRRAGGKTTNAKKRKKEDDKRFENSLRAMILDMGL
ncbi:MAG: YaiI/YqxD family protein [Maledivibacter sp.]|jgi:uncharacterized protein YaiI (UPF0178 family)|nr:YaiI/YqxD family protein [Maledivibacter sp.]